MVREEDGDLGESTHIIASDLVLTMRSTLDIRVLTTLILFPILPSFAESPGVNPWMNARRVPSVALAKEGTLRRVPPYEACGEVPQP